MGLLGITTKGTMERANVIFNRVFLLLYTMKDKKERNLEHICKMRKDVLIPCHEELLGENSEIPDKISFERGV